jgi:predicted small lipoprotein YifL
MTSVGSAAARAASLLLVLVLGGCGQRGPLTLPGEAQPIERASPTAAPAEGSAAEPDDADDPDDESPANEPANDR